MRFFFRSKQFKTVLSILLILVIVAVFSFVIGDRIAPQSDILGTIAAPFRAAFTEISGSISVNVMGFPTHRLYEILKKRGFV